MSPVPAGTAIPWIRIRDAAARPGGPVEVRGWLTHRRSSGKVQFLVVRDGSGILQCVAGVNDLDVQGEYFVYIAVYSEGGGPFVPVPGVDYVTQSERKVKFDGSPINLGTMTLRLEETP